MRSDGYCGSSGAQVEIQNYIDDTGVQVADVVGRLSRARTQNAGRSSCHCRRRQVRLLLLGLVRARHRVVCGRCRAARRSAAKALHDIEHGNNDTAALASFIADRIVRAHLKTMRRMNIGYDLLTWEGDILRLHFWTHAFEFLKKTGAVFLQTEGKLKGCWVMRIDGWNGGGRRRQTRRSAGGGDEEPREKVIVRSDGTVTYVGKDMAYQLWKFGLLGKDFHYRVFETEPRRRCGRPPRIQEATRPLRQFGRASWVCNVIDTRQSYLQKLLKQALAALGYVEQAATLDSLLVRDGGALARNRARARATTRSEDSDRPFVEVSGRKGLGVKADDLLDRVTDKAAAEVAKRNTDLSADQIAAASPSRLPRRPSAISWSSSRAEK